MNSILLQVIIGFVATIVGYVVAIFHLRYKEKRKKAGIEPPFFNFSVFEITRYYGILNGIEILTIEYGNWTGSLLSIINKDGKGTSWKIDLLWTRQLIERIAQDRVA
jgi:hypothetical protein